MSKKSPTVEEQKWMDKVSRMGCIVCREASGAYVENEVHHMTSGGRRLGHMFTLPLCLWHHRKVTTNGLSEAYMLQLYGPSVEHGRKVFEAAFGPEEDILERVKKWLGYQNKSDSLPSTATSSPSSTTSG